MELDTRIYLARTVAELVAVYLDAQHRGYGVAASHMIEDRAEDGTIYAEVFGMLCDGTLP